MEARHSYGTSAIVVLVLVTLLTYYLYRVFSHPLNAVPGPFLAKFTPARFFYHTWKGDLHLDHIRCHKRYGGTRACPRNLIRANKSSGPVYRSAPNRVVFNTLSATQGELTLALLAIKY